MHEQCDVPLAALTTLRLGGPARRVVTAETTEELIDCVTAVDRAGEPLLILGAGSNLVAPDAGFPGTVVRIRTQGVRRRAESGAVHLTASAGVDWDRLVEASVEDGLAGVECLSGIPGLVGATPMQNVGAYGQDVADVVVAVTAYDRRREQRLVLSGAECGFDYRTSVFKTTDRYVVLDVTYALTPSRQGAAVRYAELAAALGVRVGDPAPLAAVRAAVLELRRGKGMVIDPADPDSVSAGSFFTNPVLGAERAIQLPADAPRWPLPDGRVKTSAAWLIEHAGFPRGYGAGPVGISTKHTLALVNRGGASTAQLLALASELRDGVRDRFGVELHHEPVLVASRRTDVDPTAG